MGCAGRINEIESLPIQCARPLVRGLFNRPSHNQCIVNSAARSLGVGAALRRRIPS